MSHQPSADPVVPVSLGPRPRILIVKLATRGDLLLTTPALRALRERYPAARLDILTTPSSAPLLASSPLVDHTYTLDTPVAIGYRKTGRYPPRLAALTGRLLSLRRAEYDALALAHHLTLPAGRWKHRALVGAINARLAVGLDNGHGGWLDLRVPDAGFGARHEADYFLQMAEALDAAPSPTDRRLDAADLGWGDLTIARPAPGQPLRVALHPGSGLYSVARRWPVESFVELARRLHERTGATVVVIAGEGERALAERFSSLLGQPTWVVIRADKTTPRQLAQTLSECDLFVGNDSFPMHLAVTLQVPTVALFGPTNVRAWGPYAPGAGAAVAVRRGDLSCSPCVYRGHALGTPQGCPERPCLTQLPVSAALEAALSLLKRRDERALPAG